MFKETVHIANSIDIGNKKQQIHLGDAIVSLNLIYNRYLTTGRTIDVYGVDWIGQLFDLFEYEGVNFCGPYDYCIEPNISFLQLMPKIDVGVLNGNKSDIGFLKSDVFLNINNKTTELYHEFKLPNVKLKSDIKLNETLFQFDSRSLQDVQNKTALSKYQCIESINLLKEKGTEVFGIGGIETPRYLNYEFKLGNLIEISKYLLSCKKFIGIDSGISHLAATLRVPSEIICLFNTEPRTSEVIQAYNLFYPNLKIHKKSILLEPKCKIHL